MILFSVIPVLCLTVLALRYYSHMLQLSSYQFQGYFRFLRSIKGKLIAHVAFAVLFLVWLLLPENKGIVVPLILAAAMLIVFVFLLISYLPKEAKKKFVVTNRVKRLFITYSVLILLICIIPEVLGNMAVHKSYGIGGRYVVWTLWITGTVVLALLPLIPALANLINKPIENRVNQYYIDDAKRILKEHPGLRIIGITGSFGKTSVKYYLTTLYQRDTEFS